MNKLNKEQLMKLENGAQCFVRLSRVLYPEPPIVKFYGLEELSIQKFQTKKGKRIKEHMIITTKNWAWAEGSDSDISEDGSIMVEDYLMEVYG